jgi:hypothetical protein
MTPSPKPISIEYKRWRHKASGYEVVFVGIRHWEGKHGVFSEVTVRGSRWKSDLLVTWPGKTFLRIFEPIGRKFRIKSRWERLLAE